MPGASPVRWTSWRAPQRLFGEAARAMGTEARFEVVRTSAAQAIASISQAGDVVLVAEPRSAAERVTHSFLSLVEAAFVSDASKAFNRSSDPLTFGVVFSTVAPVHMAGAVILNVTKAAYPTDFMMNSLLFISSLLIITKRHKNKFLTHFLVPRL